jgi:hypothetical protein
MPDWRPIPVPKNELWTLSMIRSVQPEILDTLDPEAPQAIRARSELQHINRWMGNYRWFTKTLNRNYDQTLKELIEVGAMGSLLPRLLECGTPSEKWHYTALDRLPAPASFPAYCRWVQQPVESYEGWRFHQTFVSNLLLHQLEPQVLRRLGARMGKHIELIVCNEPYRHTFFYLAATLLFRLFGYSKITRHDGLISIRGGFKWGELPTILGLEKQNWTIAQSITLFGSYRLVAIRKTYTHA